MIKYPNKKVTSKSDATPHSKRGMNFENEINLSNQYYVENNIAHIYKKPTPIKVVKVEYSKSSYSTKRHKISEAYYQEPSTTDYNGIYKGRYIDFEAKHVKNKSFNMGANLKKHQYEHLVKVKEHGGIAFLMVQFSSMGKTYILDIVDLKKFIDKEQKVVIPLKYFEDYGYEIENGYIPALKYIEIIDELILKE